MVAEGSRVTSKGAITMSGVNVVGVESEDSREHWNNSLVTKGSRVTFMGATTINDCECRRTGVRRFKGTLEQLAGC